MSEDTVNPRPSMNGNGNSYSPSARIRSSHIRLFRSYVPVFFLWLAVLEALVSFGALYAGIGARMLVDADSVLRVLGDTWPKALIWSLVMTVSMTSVGLYQRRLREGFSGVVVRVAASFLIGSITMTMLFYIFPSLLTGRGIIAFAVVFGLIGTLALRAMFLHIVDVDGLKKRILVLGAGQKASLVTELRRKTDCMGFNIIGYVKMADAESHVEKDLLVDIGGSLSEFIAENKVDELVIAVDDRRRRLPLEEILDCKMRGLEICDLLTFFERETGKIKLDILDISWMVFSDGFRSGVVRAYVKRAFDVVSSGIVLLCTWPIMLVTAIIIKLEDKGRGPIFYKQTRIGQEGKPFDVIKFRSMRTDAEKDGVAQWATANDNRVTRIGKFIRKTRIDELPQIFNVFKGDMSFVGPRPERPQFVDQLNKNIPFYNERHRVKPGITGWAQICYPYGASEEDSYEKLQYDLFYVKNFSLLMDLMILLQTGEVVLWGKGAR